jgi:hypothetical protein
MDLYLQRKQAARRPRQHGLVPDRQVGKAKKVHEQDKHELDDEHPQSDLRIHQANQHPSAVSNA